MGNGGSNKMLKLNYSESKLRTVWNAEKERLQRNNLTESPNSK